MPEHAARYPPGTNGKNRVKEKGEYGKAFVTRWYHHKFIFVFRWNGVKGNGGQGLVGPAEIAPDDVDGHNGGQEIIEENGGQPEPLSRRESRTIGLHRPFAATSVRPDATGTRDLHAPKSTPRSPEKDGTKEGKVGRADRERKKLRRETYRGLPFSSLFQRLCIQNHCSGWARTMRSTAPV